MATVNLQEIIRKLRRYEIRIRKAVNTRMHGDFHSIFKGSGLEFDDIRSYQYGDDVRSIHWAATAKEQGVFVKTFREEKEQSVFFLLDVSASQKIGRAQKKKIDVVNEICGVLALSAIKEGSHTGAVCYSDQKEKYIKPGKGPGHGYSLISEVFSLEPKSKKTNLNEAIKHTLNLLRRKSVVVFISDFIDINYFDTLKAMARRHDLVLIHVFDGRETKLPGLGIIPVREKETGKVKWINSSGSTFKKQISGQFADIKTELQDFCHKHQISYQTIDTASDFVPELVRLFRVRNLKKAAN